MSEHVPRVRCPGCGRQTTLNIRGTIRAHRTLDANGFAGEYCRWSGRQLETNEVERLHDLSKRCEAFEAELSRLRDENADLRKQLAQAGDDVAYLTSLLDRLDRIERGHLWDDGIDDVARRVEDLVGGGGGG
jgi:chromosome condensin MukBEF ATPase and DNA-binding subunit MukB